MSEKIKQIPFNHPKTIVCRYSIKRDVGNPCPSSDNWTSGFLDNWTTQHPGSPSQDLTSGCINLCTVSSQKKTFAESAERQLKEGTRVETVHENKK